jgi:hypothetical protein
MKIKNQRRVNYAPEGTVKFPNDGTRFLSEEFLPELAAWCDAWRASALLDYFIINRPVADWKYFAKSKDGQYFQYYPNDGVEKQNSVSIDDGLYRVWGKTYQP